MKAVLDDCWIVFPILPHKQKYKVQNDIELILSFNSCWRYVENRHSEVNWMCPCTKSPGKLGFCPGPSLVKKPDPRFVYFKYQQLTFKLRDIVSVSNSCFFVTILGQVSNVSPTYLRNSHLFPQIPDHIPIFSHIFPKIPSYSLTFLGIPRNFWK